MRVKVLFGFVRHGANKHRKLTLCEPSVLWQSLTSKSGDILCPGFSILVNGEEGETDQSRASFFQTGLTLSSGRACPCTRAQ